LNAVTTQEPDRNAAQCLRRALAKATLRWPQLRSPARWIYVVAATWCATYRKPAPPPRAHRDAARLDLNDVWALAELEGSEVVETAEYRLVRLPDRSPIRCSCNGCGPHDRPRRAGGRCRAGR
jgi:hypothetical protein